MERVVASSPKEEAAKLVLVCMIQESLFFTEIFRRAV